MLDRLAREVVERRIFLQSKGVSLVRDFLVYTSAGMNSNVHHWASKKRSYDIWVTNYSDVAGNLREYSDHYNESRGAKFPNFKRIVDKHAPLLSQYKAIMVADDDIIISPKKLDNLFRFLEEKDLWIVTPAFSRFGKLSHTGTQRMLSTHYRYTNFAEVTCPIIRTDKLLDFMDVYDGEITCYGVDWWYLNFFGKNVQDKIVISDDNYCINPRDFLKGGREIDRVLSHNRRVQLWEAKKSELNISSFKVEMYEAFQRSALERLQFLPGYIAENAFQVVWDSRLLARLRRVAKSVLRRDA